MSSESHQIITDHYQEKTQILLKDMPDYVTDFWKEIQTEKTERTQYEYILDIRRLLSYLSVGKPLANITLTDLDNLSQTDFETYFDTFVHYKENGKDIYNGQASIKRKIAAVRSFLKYLYQNGKIQSTAILKVSVPKITEEPAVCLTEKEVMTLTDYIRTGTGLSKKQQDYHKYLCSRDLSIIMLILSSGIRVSECVELDVTDLHMTDLYINILRHKDKFTVHFSCETMECLKQYLYARSLIPDADKEPALFLSSQRQRLTTRSVENMIRKYTRIAIPDKKITPHNLRATCGSRLLAVTGNTDLVAEKLGYKTVKAMQDKYTDKTTDNNI